VAPVRAFDTGQAGPVLVKATVVSVAGGRRLLGGVGARAGGSGSDIAAGQTQRKALGLCGKVVKCFV